MEAHLNGCVSLRVRVCPDARDAGACPGVPRVPKGTHADTLPEKQTRPPMRPGVRTHGGLVMGNLALDFPGCDPLQVNGINPPTHPRRRHAFFVAGDPKPMGSKTAFVVKGRNGPRAVVTDGSTSKPAGKLMLAWKDAVIAASMAELGNLERILGPVSVEVTFHLARPFGHYGKGKRAGLLTPSAPKHPAVKPDLDKLCRSTLDALKVGIISDDARVIRLVAAKVYAIGATGAHITVVETE